MKTLPILFVALVALVLAQLRLSAESAEAQRLFEIAEQARIENRAEDARAAFDSLFSASPDHREGHEAWQNMRWSEGEEEELLKEYAAYLEENDTADAHFLLARITLDPEKREALLRQGMDKDPQHLKLKQYWAEFLMRQNRFEEVDKAILDVIEMTPREANIHNLHIQTRRSVEEIAELEAHYRAEINKDPEDYFYHLLLGMLMMHSDRAEEAVIACERAYELAPEEEDVIQGRIVIALAARLTPLAETLLEHFETMAPRNTYLSLRSKVAYLTDDNAERALEYSSEAVRLEPLSPDDYKWLAMFHAMLEQDDQAEAALKEALRRAPNDIETLNNFAALYYTQERYEESLELAEKALRADPSRVSYSNLSEIYLKLGRHEEAREAMAKAKANGTQSDLSEQTKIARNLSDDEADDVLINFLAVQLAQDGQYEEARKRLLDLLEKQPDSYTNHFYLARIESRAFRDEVAALKHWKQAQALIPNGDEHTYYRAAIAESLAWCHEALGQTDEAVAVLDHFLNENEDYNDADRLRELSERMKTPRAEQERFQLEAVQVKGCLRDAYCLPTSLATILDHWEHDADPREIGRRVREMSEKHELFTAELEFLEELKGEGFGVRYFTPNVERIKGLLKADCPVMLMGDLVYGTPPTYGGHATVVAGYDDRTRYLMLEDANWFAGLHHLDYTYIPDMIGVLIAPTEVIEKLDIDLPDHEYHHLVLQSQQHLGRRNPEEAKRLLRKAISLRNDAPHAYKNLGRVYYGEEDFDQAEWEWMEAARHTVRDPTPEALLGTMFVRRGMHYDAIRWLTDALEKEPRYVDAHRLLTYSLALTQDFEGAIPHAREALKHNPDDLNTMVNLGSFLRETGALDEAEEVFQSQSIKNSYQAHYGLALIEGQRYVQTRKIENLDLADKHLIEAVELAKVEGTSEELKQIEVTQAQYKKAREMVEAEQEAETSTH